MNATREVQLNPNGKRKFFNAHQEEKDILPIDK